MSDLRDEQVLQEILNNDMSSQFNHHESRDKQYESGTLDLDKIVPSVSIKGEGRMLEATTKFNYTSYNRNDKKG